MPVPPSTTAEGPPESAVSEAARPYPGVGHASRHERERVMRMYPARRLASVAVSAALAVAGLSACRSAPDVAAYVGRTRITEQRVSDVLKGAQANQVPAQQAAVSRQDVVETLIGLDVMRALARQHGVSATAIDRGRVAQALGVNARSEYVALYTEYRGLLNALSAGVEPAQPTQADIRDVYDRLTKGGANPNGASFEQFAGSLAPRDQDTLSQNIGLRNRLQPEIQKLNTTVNPRYRSPELPLVSAQGGDGTELPLVVLKLAPAKSEPPVVDVS